MAADAQELTGETFDRETASGVTLVDFWAPWCGPCRMQAPILDEVGDRMAGKAKMAKVNVDEAPELAARFGVRSIPTLVILKDGEKVEQLVGLRKADELVQALEKHV